MLIFYENKTGFTDCLRMLTIQINVHIDISRFAKNNNKLSNLGLSCVIFYYITANVGSYTQGRTAGDFLSSRKTARAERCPPKTAAAGLAG